MKEEEFCIVDLWAAEAYLTALDAQEPVLLEMLNRGEKIHNWLLEKTKEVFPKEVEQFAYTYKGAKQNVHSLNYGVEPAKMSIESRLPLNVSEWQYAFYHGTFPGIKMRQLRIRRTVESTRSITSLLGRKKIFFAPLSREILNQAYAWPSQSVIGELTNVALAKLYYSGITSTRTGKPWTYPCLNTHDGLAIRVFRHHRPEIKRQLEATYNLPVTKDGMKIVIPVELGWAENFNDVKEKEVIRYA